ncbi:hypothetical protein D623_10014899 [Myotis brandtii]|uniref:Uncharacterized protein n=1 Tax=Myotis brandtii TaxID=109478 RepID=S7NKW6_MYOBR|nr:hypothetical protein D623_10014899 [Myotis brandtii]
MLTNQCPQGRAAGTQNDTAAAHAEAECLNTFIANPRGRRRSCPRASPGSVAHLLLLRLQRENRQEQRLQGSQGQSCRCDQHPSQTLTAARWKDTTRKIKAGPGGQPPVLVPVSQITETQTHPPRLWGDPSGGAEEHVENVCHRDNTETWGLRRGPRRCRTSQ